MYVAQEKVIFENKVNSKLELEKAGWMLQISLNPIEKIFVLSNICHSNENTPHETCSGSNTSSWHAGSSDYSPTYCPASSGNNIRLRHAVKSPEKLLPITWKIIFSHCLSFVAQYFCARKTLFQESSNDKLCTRKAESKITSKPIILMW